MRVKDRGLASNLTSIYAMWQRPNTDSPRISYFIAIKNRCCNSLSLSFFFLNIMTFDLLCGNDCGLCLAVFRGKNCLLMSVSDEKKNGSKIECYDVHILKCAEQTSSCTSRRALCVCEKVEAGLR